MPPRGKSPNVTAKTSRMICPSQKYGIDIPNMESVDKDTSSIYYSVREGFLPHLKPHLRK